MHKTSYNNYVKPLSKHRKSMNINRHHIKNRSALRLKNNKNNVNPWEGHLKHKNSNRPCIKQAIKTMLNHCQGIGKTGKSRNELCTSCHTSNNLTGYKSATCEHLKLPSTTLPPPPPPSFVFVSPTGEHLRAQSVTCDRAPVGCWELWMSSTDVSSL